MTEKIQDARQSPEPIPSAAMWLAPNPGPTLADSDGRTCSGAISLNRFRRDPQVAAKPQCSSVHGSSLAYRPQRSTDRATESGSEQPASLLESASISSREADRTQILPVAGDGA